MSALNRPNTVLELDDGELATTCYNGLDGIGVKYGEHRFDADSRDFPEPDEILDDKMGEDRRIRRIVKEGGWE